MWVGSDETHLKGAWTDFPKRRFLIQTIHKSHKKSWFQISVKIVQTIWMHEEITYIANIEKGMDWWFNDFDLYMRSE